MTHERHQPVSLPFGRHRGWPLGEVPTDYLLWLLRTCKLSTGLQAAVRAELLSRPNCPPQLDPEPGPGPVRCRRCGGTDLRLYWQQLAGAGGRAIRADCRRCRRFVAFVPQTAANVAAADAAQPPAALLDVLIRAEEEGVEVVRRGERLALLPPGKASPELEVLVRQNTRGLLQMLPPRSAR
jgi:hypothetical protein